MASKKKAQRRHQVPELSDAEPLHRQLDEYYMQREKHNIYDAPLEWQSEPSKDPGQRPPMYEGEQQETWTQIAEDDLVKKSTRGSKPFKAAELRRGYRKV